MAGKNVYMARNKTWWSHSMFFPNLLIFEEKICDK